MESLFKDYSKTLQDHLSNNAFSKTYVFHHNDLDGKCSAAIIKYFLDGGATNTRNNEGVDFRNNIEFIESQYGDESKPWFMEKVEEALNNKKALVFVVDYSFSSPVMMRWLLHAPDRFVWIDHHNSAIRKVQAVLDEAGQSNFVPIGARDEALSGCELTWDWAVKNLLNSVKRFRTIKTAKEGKYPHVVRMLGRWDVWDHTNPMCIPYQYGMRIVENDPTSRAWVDLFESSRKGKNKDFNYDDQIYSIGDVVMTYRYVRDEALLKNAYRTTVDFEGVGPKQILAINIVFEDDYPLKGIATPDDDLVCWYHQRKDGTWSYSLRSNPVEGKEETAVNLIAEIYGGGGHKGAAGFVSDKLLFSPTKKG